MSIILARHGQTELNAEKRILGVVDSPLTGRGKAAAESLAGVLGTMKIDRSFASPLGRAQATARILTRDLDLEVAPRPEMAELSAGDWEGKTRVETIGEDAPIRRDWLFRPPEGESYQDGTNRLIPFVEELRELSGTTLVVGHFAINRCFLQSWLALEPDLVMTVDIPHEAFYLLEEDGGISWIDNQGGQGQGFLDWEYF